MNNKVVYLEDIIEKFTNGPSQLDKDQIIYLINRVPSFDRSFDRPQGEWEKVTESIWKCSLCDAIMFTDSNYCPNCGAKMNGERSEE